MKKILLLFTTICFYQLQAQNLVNNPGFETYSALPTSVAQYNNAIGWNNCNGGGSPDYFHNNGSGLVKLPNCFIGTVNAYSGAAIMGAALYYHSPSNYREYISSQFVTPMVIGQTYNISFYISNGVTSGTYGGGGIDQVSVALSSYQLTQNGTGPINIVPQYTYGSVLYSHSWQLVSFQYTADSAYRYFALGNFKSDLSTQYQQFDPCTSYGAYYFFDGLTVQPVSNLPVTNFISSDTAFCDESGKCIDFTDHSTNNPTSWKWLFPGAIPDTSSQQNPASICYFSPGTYAVTLIATNAAGADTLVVSPMIIFGSTPPSPFITNAGGDTLVCSHASFYQWYFNGVPISAATDSFYVAINDGNYNVYITDSIGCSRLGNGFVFVGINNFNDNSEGISIYPNPVEDKLILTCPSNISANAGIEIYNTLGGKVFQLQNITLSGETVIPVSALSKGIYFLRIRLNNQESINRKFVVLRK